MRRGLAPEALLVLTFGGLILAGTALLSLPASQTAERVGILDCLFTSTSAVCVTGLTTVDTGTRWTLFGQLVILALIQLGGLGVMTFAALAGMLLRRPVSFSSAAALHDAFFDSEARLEMGRALLRIVLITLAIELVGAIVLYTELRTADRERAVFAAVFLSISAYCNAGFSVYSDSVVGLRHSAVVIWTIMILITAGGIGYHVLIEIAQRAKRRLFRQAQPTVRWSLHTRVVLVASALLTFGGALAIGLAGLTAAEADAPMRAVHALFQSVTARTAGFNTVDVGALPVPTLLILTALMFVGGSPGSTAGGIKTTSAAVLAATLQGRLVGRTEPVMWGRTIPTEVARKAGLGLALAVVWNAAGVLLLSFTENLDRTVRFEYLVFEQVSAFCTVGLSCNFTTELSPVGKAWIIASMYVGRLGTLTIAFFVIHARRPRFRYPTERIMIG
ncbi:MAG: TrkH family potassium uptake protein [Phycisphaerae bacterium]